MNQEQLRKIQQAIVNETLEKNRASLCFVLGKLAKQIQEKMIAKNNPIGRNVYRLCLDKMTLSVVLRNVSRRCKEYGIDKDNEYLFKYVFYFFSEDIDVGGKLLNDEDRTNLMLGWLN